MYQKPLVVHPSSRNIYVIEELDEEGEVSEQLTAYADVKKTPEHLHTFNLSPYALWTAKAKGIKSEEVISFLEENCQHLLSASFKESIQNDMDHFGALSFSIKDNMLYLHSKSEALMNKIRTIESINSKIIREPNGKTLVFKLRYRTEIKKELFKNHFFVKDVRFNFGDVHNITYVGKELYEYHKEAVKAYLGFNKEAGGGGTIIMPPNSGILQVGLKLIEELRTSTLIIVEDKYKVERWKNAVKSDTDIAEQNISIYEESGSPLKPITIGTYGKLADSIESLDGFGFIIFDDAHKLPTKKNIKLAEVKAKNKLALASTLARADGDGNLVLGLIGPRWYEVSYPTLVRKKYHIPVKCIEVKVPMPVKEEKEYKKQSRNTKVNAATLNTNKLEAINKLIKNEVTKRMLIVSHYNPMLDRCEETFDELITLRSSLSEDKRKQIITNFNAKKINKMIVSSKLIEHMSLSQVEVMIAASYHEGSEREEYLRLGKLLPVEKGKGEAVLYSLVSKKTREEEYYINRRQRLINYGFQYRIWRFDDLMKRGDNIESL